MLLQHPRLPAQRVLVTTPSHLLREWARAQPAHLAPVTTPSLQLREWARAPLPPPAESLVRWLLAPRAECLAPVAQAASVPVAQLVQAAHLGPQALVASVPAELLEQAPVLVHPHVPVLVLTAHLPAAPAAVAAVPAVVPLVPSVVAAERARLASQSVRREQNSSFARLHRSVA
jgi:hypothetical protein